MDIVTFTCVLALIAGFYASWNIGANDVSNAMGTSVGSKSITLRQAVIIAAACEFLGAWLFGSRVSETLRSGIIDTSIISSHEGSMTLILGMLSSLLATGIWLHIASFWGLPVSTTHSIVGAIVGFGFIAGGNGAIHWPMLGRIASSWIMSPVLGCIGAYTIFTIIRKVVLSKPAPLKAARAILPLFFAVLISFFLALWLNLQAFSNHYILLGSTTAFALSVSIFRWVESVCVSQESPEEKVHAEEMERLMALQHEKRTLLLSSTTPESIQRRCDIDRELHEISSHFHPASVAHYEEKQFHRVERIFGLLQIVTACLMAFAHGANDVANAIGPLEAILAALAQKDSFLAQTILPYSLLLGGVGIIIGLATWGWRVIETIGKNITELTPSRGFSAEFGASMTILFSSTLGLPISTTHTLVGAVIGVGLAGGITTLNIKTLRDIIASWMITIPGGAVLSIIWYQILKTVYSFTI